MVARATLNIQKIIKQLKVLKNLISIYHGYELYKKTQNAQATYHESNAIINFQVTSIT